MTAQETIKGYMDWLAREPERYAEALQPMPFPELPYTSLREFSKDMVRATNERIDNCLIAKDLCDYRFIHKRDI